MRQWLLHLHKPDLCYKPRLLPHVTDQKALRRTILLAVILSTYHSKWTQTQIQSTRTDKWCSSIPTTRTVLVNRKYRIWILHLLLSHDMIQSKNRKCAKTWRIWTHFLNSHQSQGWRRTILGIIRLWLKVVLKQRDYQRYLVKSADRTVAVERAEIQPMHMPKSLQLAFLLKRIEVLLPTGPLTLMNLVQYITSQLLALKAKGSSMIEVSQHNSSDKQQRLEVWIELELRIC